MNKIIVITGGTSGIGYEMAKLFEQMGDTVICLARSIKEANKTNIVCDVANEQMVASAIEQIVQNFGRIDVVVNNAGYGISGAMELIPAAEAQKQFDVNMLGAFFVNKYAIKHMPKGSKIVHIASACSLFALPFRGLYCASKAALNMYSECLSMELKPLGIKVVSVCPGDVKTNFTKNRVKIFETNQKYGDRIANSAHNIDKNQEKRMSATMVAKKIVKIANKKNPKPMYIIGAKYKLFYFASKVFSRRVMLFATEKMFNGKKRHK